MVVVVAREKMSANEGRSLQPSPGRKGTEAVWKVWCVWEGRREGGGQACARVCVQRAVPAVCAVRGGAHARRVWVCGVVGRKV